MLRRAFGNNAVETTQPSVRRSRFKRVETSAEVCERSNSPSTCRTHEKVKSQRRHGKLMWSNFGDRWHVRLHVWHKPTNSKGTGALQEYCLQISGKAGEWKGHDFNQKEETYPDGRIDLAPSKRPTKKTSTYPDGCSDLPPSHHVANQKEETYPDRPIDLASSKRPRGKVSCCRLKQHSRQAPATTNPQATRFQCVRTVRKDLITRRSFAKSEPRLLTDEPKQQFLATRNIWLWSSTHRTPHTWTPVISSCFRK